MTRFKTLKVPKAWFGAARLTGKEFVAVLKVCFSPVKMSYIIKHYLTHSCHKVIVCLLVVIGEINDKVIKTFKAYCRFYFLVSLPSHTESDLNEIERIHEEFLEHVQVFKSYSATEFKFIKMHMMSLYS